MSSAFSCTRMLLWNRGFCFISSLGMSMFLLFSSLLNYFCAEILSLCCPVTTVSLCVFNVGERNESVCEVYSEQNPERKRMICHLITPQGRLSPCHRGCSTEYDITASTQRRIIQQGMVSIGSNLQLESASICYSQWFSIIYKVKCNHLLLYSLWWLYVLLTSKETANWITEKNSKVLWVILLFYELFNK